MPHFYHLLVLYHRGLYLREKLSLPPPSWGDEHLGSQELTPGKGRDVCGEAGRRWNVTLCQMFTGELTQLEDGGKKWLKTTKLSLSALLEERAIGNLGHRH